MASSLRQALQIYFVQFNTKCLDTASGKCTHEVLAESLETVFDEAHFIVNLHNFIQPLDLLMHTIPPSEPFVPRQSNFQNSSPLDIS